MLAMRQTLQRKKTKVELRSSIELSMLCSHSLTHPRLQCLGGFSCVCGSVPKEQSDIASSGLVHSCHWGGLVFVEELGVVLDLQLQLLLEDALDHALDHELPQ